MTFPNRKSSLKTIVFIAGEVRPGVPLLKVLGPIGLPIFILRLQWLTV
jgi:hypothetical protein